MKSNGFTLIELMISVALVGFVTLAGYSVFMNVLQFQVLQERQTAMQTRLQLAMDLLASDISAAGFGMINPRDIDPLDTSQSSPACGTPNTFRGVRAVMCASTTQNDNVAFGADGIALSARDQLLGRLSVPPVVGTSNIVVAMLQNVALPAVGTDITIDGFYTSTVNGAAGGLGVDAAGNTLAGLNLNTILDPRHDEYSIGMDVYTVANIVYNIGLNPAGCALATDVPCDLALFRTLNGGAAVIVANGIEDLQVRYIQPNGNAVDPPVTTFSAVRVSLVARTRDADPNYVAGQRILPLENNVAPAAAVNDNRFRRAVLTRVIEPRNDGI